MTLLPGGTTTVPLGGTTTLLLGGTTTLTSLGRDDPPPLLELHAARTGTDRMRMIGIMFLGVIGCLSLVLSLKQFVGDGL
jgi:hypothetical protein